MKANEEDTRARQFREAELRSRVDSGIKGVIEEAKAASSGDLTSAQLRQRSTNRKTALERQQDATGSALRDAADAANPSNVTDLAEFEKRRAAIEERDRRMAELSRDDDDDFNAYLRRARLNEDPA